MRFNGLWLENSIAIDLFVRCGEIDNIYRKTVPNLCMVLENISKLKNEN